ncbi:MAG: biopolymer transporter ExbD [Pseudomonadota bacterium]
MAFGGSSGSGNVRSEINVTPLVDVVLVLLIIFLVTMPILMRDIGIEVPRKLDDTDVPIDIVPTQQLVIEWKDDGRLLVNDEEINRVDLAAKVREKLERKRDKVVFVSFGDSVRYGDAVSVMDTCRGAGATTVALKMKTEETQ